MNTVIHTRLGESRRVAIPVELCRQHAMKPGDAVVLESTAYGIMLRSTAEVLREVQTAFASLRTDGESNVEAILAERRVEFEREECHG